MKKPHYYYKVAARSRVGMLLKEFLDQCHEAEEKARQWAYEYGASSYYESPEGMAGGVAAVEFTNTISKDGWEYIATPDGRVMFLPEADSELEKEMYALPIVSEMQLIGILSFKPKTNKEGTKAKPFTFGDTTPVVFLHEGHWYVDVPYESGAEECFAIGAKQFLRHQSLADKN